MRLKNKYFLYNVKKKVNILSSKFFVLHLDQNSSFDLIKDFCIENNFFLYKVKNSLYKKFFFISNPFSCLLKGSTFFLFFENFFDYIKILSFYEKNKKLKKNFYFLSLYENFILYSLSQNMFYYMKFKKFLYNKHIFLFVFFILNRFIFLFFNFFKVYNNLYANNKSIN
uniref:Uncharacterized protein n=1 Tax=Clydonella sawyeri TaxID=2201168 RepID=A0A2U9DQS5_9EUKA|nr:hypothetical protein [Clydonella sawyeri]